MAPAPVGSHLQGPLNKTWALQPTPEGSKLGEAKDRRFKANQITRILEVWLVLTKKHEVFAHVGED